MARSKSSYYDRNKERIKRNAREYYRDNKNRISQKRKMKYETEKLLKRVAVLPNGRKVMLFSVSEFANLIGKATSTIRGWEMKGITPPPILSTQKGRRVYTQEEVELYDEILTEHDRDMDAFKEAIWERTAALRKEFEL